MARYCYSLLEADLQQLPSRGRFCFSLRFPRHNILLRIRRNQCLLERLPCPCCRAQAVGSRTLSTCEPCFRNQQQSTPSCQRAGKLRIRWFGCVAQAMSNNTLAKKKKKLKENSLRVVRSRAACGMSVGMWNYVPISVASVGMLGMLALLCPVHPM